MKGSFYMTMRNLLEMPVIFLQYALTACFIGMQKLLDMLPILLPIIILQCALAIYCIIDIVRKGVRNLNVAAWILIVVFINLIGSIVYLLIGRKGDSN
jgi:hypothetical protein